jgi:putative methyltransferase
MSSSPYAPAAGLLQQIWTTRKSLKTCAYDDKGNLRCSKATYAQVCHVLESRNLLEQVLEQVPFTQVRNEGLLYILLYELLLGPNKSIRGGGALKRQIVKKQRELQEALQLLQQDDDNSTARATVSFPRYVRVNTLVTTTKQVVQELHSQQIQVFMDQHVPNLLVLPPATSLHQHALVKSAKVVLQDKSSCFSALCLVHGNDVPLQGDCLDACAAPGNKTSHLAALLAETSSATENSKTVVHALDRSSTRLALLDQRIQHLVQNFTKNTQVVTHHLDFLKTRPADYPQVRGILLDPSCSGSGIFTSPDRRQEKRDDERITTLSNFQLTTLLHAMSFSQVERIVYSTCSLHEEENELVVSQALSSSCNQEANGDSIWKLVAPSCLQHWKRRGHVVDALTREQASCLVRSNQNDETNGFFVAYFERIKKRDAGVNATYQKKTRINESIKGLTLYNGEFVTVNTTSTSTTTNADDPPAPARPKTKKDEISPKKPIGKKKAKKLAWKRRQMEQKLKRIEKRQQQQQE